MPGEVLRRPRARAHQLGELLRAPAGTPRAARGRRRAGSPLEQVEHALERRVGVRVRRPPPRSRAAPAGRAAPGSRPASRGSARRRASPSAARRLPAGSAVAQRGELATRSSRRRRSVPQRAQRRRARVAASAAKMSWKWRVTRCAVRVERVARARGSRASPMPARDELAIVVRRRQDVRLLVVEVLQPVLEVAQEHVGVRRAPATASARAGDCGSASRRQHGQRRAARAAPARARRGSAGTPAR